MANKRVVDLPQAEKMLDGDILHIIQSGIDKQIPANKVGGDGIKKADTLAEAEAMVESGDLEDRGIVLVENDGDGVPSPSELAEIKRDINQLKNDVNQLKNDSGWITVYTNFKVRKKDNLLYINNRNSNIPIDTNIELPNTFGLVYNFTLLPSFLSNGGWLQINEQSRKIIVVGKTDVRGSWTVPMD